MLDFVFIVIFLTLTFLQAFKKWGWLDYYQARRLKWMPDGGCYLCLGFWLSIPIAYGYHLLAISGYWFAVVPFAVAGMVNTLSLLVRLLSHESLTN